MFGLFKKMTLHVHETDAISVISPDVDTFMADLLYEYLGDIPEHEAVSIWTKPGFTPTFD